MENENNKNGKYTGYFSKRLKAGKRRTYFFDVRSTKHGDFFLTITESKKKQDESFESHKIFLYKEDFKKFLETLSETLDYVKTELMPDYDYDSKPVSKTHHNNNHEGPANHDREEVLEGEKTEKPERIVSNSAETENTSTPPIGDDEEIDWN